MKIRNLALVLMLGVALTACQKGQDTAAADAAAQAAAVEAAAAQQAADTQQKLADAQKAAEEAQAAAEQARKDAAAAEKRAARAERTQVASSTPKPAVCSACGTVTAITASKVKPDGSGAGAVLGAAAGGVAGHQVGGGRGKDVATVLGALAGAYAGNQAEKAVRAETVYTVDIKLDNGSSRSITVKDVGTLTVGSKVRVDGDVISPRG
ncbi:MAG: glycine zipper 2TM domain-containing protein [Pseudomonadota bacterium]